MLQWFQLLTDAGLLAVALAALVFARGQSKAARTANELTQQAQRHAAIAQREASEQTELESKAAIRPYVYASLEPGLHGAGSWDLVIRNSGRSPARELTIETTWPDDGDEHCALLRKFCEQPRDLMPSCSLRVMWRQTPGHGKTYTDGSDHLGQDAVTRLVLRYSDDVGDHWTERATCDTTLCCVMPLPYEGDTSIGGDDRTLRDINHALRALNVHVGGLRW